MKNIIHVLDETSLSKQRGLFKRTTLCGKGWKETKEDSPNSYTISAKDLIYSPCGENEEMCPECVRHEDYVMFVLASLKEGR